MRLRGKQPPLTLQGRVRARSAETRETGLTFSDGAWTPLGNGVVHLLEALAPLMQTTAARDAMRRCANAVRRVEYDPYDDLTGMG